VFVADGEALGDKAMRATCKTATRTDGKPRGGTVRSLYEAALREVEADPVAAVTKYQPTWLEGLSPPRAPPRANAPKPRRRD
jgi:hypothetical protein